MNAPVASEVIKVLRENYFKDEAEEIERLLNGLSSKDEDIRNAASLEIQGLCQIRAYGNLSISTMNGWKWNTLLQKLSNQARKLYNMNPRANQ